MSLLPSLLPVAALFVLAGCDSVGVVPTSSGTDSGAQAETVWPEMLDAVNAVRARGAVCGSTRYGPAPPLVWNDRLELAAARHSADMSAHDYFDHTGSDGSHPGDRATRAGYAWRAVGENIARYQTSVGQVVEDWVESPGHCHNLMDPRFAEMGAKEDGGFWTQVFGLSR